ncbi:hypothetical protein GGF46_002721 [Coemansia sp. RSA 552]|nr:hypothetical protein GGF46_002721 [Coemansia sp. RSA 552]
MADFIQTASNDTGESLTPYLAYEPRSTVAYGVGGGFAALAVASLVTALLARAYMFTLVAGSAASTMVAQFMRGSLASSSGSMEMYQATLALETAGANGLLLTASLMLGRWLRFVDGRLRATAVLAGGIGVLAAIGAAALECISMALVFDKGADLQRIGHQLAIAGAAATLGGSICGLVSTAWKAGSAARHMGTEVAALALPFALLSIWGAHALAQVKLPLRNVANSSELAFYLLSVLPPGLVLVVWLGLNVPRRFSFARQERAQGGIDNSLYEYPETEASDASLKSPRMLGAQDIHRHSTMEAEMYPHHKSQYAVDSKDDLRHL